MFTFDRDSFDGNRFGGHVGLHPLLETPEDRTEAVSRVVKSLGPELIPGIRNEVLPVVLIEHVVLLPSCHPEQVQMGSNMTKDAFFSEEALSLACEL